MYGLIVCFAVLSLAVWLFADQMEVDREHRASVQRIDAGHEPLTDDDIRGY